MIKVYTSWRSDFSKLIDNGIATHDIKQADLIIFTGGADINPMIYGQKPGSLTSYYPERDREELRDFYIGSKYKIPMLGICRGAQLLTALNGGLLIQHVNNHAGGRHLIKTYDFKEMATTSAHHQMMYPYNLPKDAYKLIAWSHQRSSSVYLGELDKPILDMDSRLEPEIVYYYKYKSLCIQGHPEWMEHNSDLVRYTNTLVRKFMLTNKLTEKSYGR